MSANVCAICGEPATVADGTVRMYLCDDSWCFHRAWDIAFPEPGAPGCCTCGHGWLQHAYKTKGCRLCGCRKIEVAA